LRHVGHVKSKHKTQRDQFDQGVTIDDNMFEFPVTCYKQSSTTNKDKKKVDQVKERKITKKNREKLINVRRNSLVCTYTNMYNI